MVGRVRRLQIHRVLGRFQRPGKIPVLQQLLRPGRKHRRTRGQTPDRQRRPLPVHHHLSCQRQQHRCRCCKRAVSCHPEPHPPQRPCLLRVCGEPVLVGLDVLGKQLHARVPFGPIPCHRPKRNRLQRGGHRHRKGLGPATDSLGYPRCCPHRTEHTAFDVPQNLGQRRAAHRRTQRQYRVQDPTQTVDVAAGIQFRHHSLGLLRRHVLGRPHHLTFQRHPVVAGICGRRFHRACCIPFPQNFCQPPVHHQHLAVLADHDVLRLEVPVQDPLGVGEGHGVAYFPENRQQCGLRVFLGRGGIAVLECVEHRLKRAALDQLH